MAITDTLRIRAEWSDGKVDAGLRGVETGLTRVGQAGQKAAAGAKQAQDGMTALERAGQRLGDAFRGAVIGYVGIQGVQALVRFGLEAHRTARASQAASSVLKNELGAAGLTSARALRELRAATGGLIADVNLLTGSARAMRAFTATGIDAAKAFQVISTSAAFASTAARAFGLNAEDAFNRIITGLARGSPQLLDDFGIMIDLQAEMFQGMTPGAQKIAVLNEAVRQMTEFLNENADAIRGTVSGIEQAAIAWSNLKTSIGTAIDEVLKNPWAVQVLFGAGGTALMNAGRQEAPNPLTAYMRGAGYRTAGEPNPENAPLEWALRQGTKATQTAAELMKAYNELFAEGMGTILETAEQATIDARYLARSSAEEARFRRIEAREREEVAPLIRPIAFQRTPTPYFYVPPLKPWYRGQLRDQYGLPLSRLYTPPAPSDFESFFGTHQTFRAGFTGAFMQPGGLAGMAGQMVGAGAFSIVVGGVMSFLQKGLPGFREAAEEQRRAARALELAAREQWRVTQIQTARTYLTAEARVLALGGFSGEARGREWEAAFAGMDVRDAFWSNRYPILAQALMIGRGGGALEAAELIRTQGITELLQVIGSLGAEVADPITALVTAMLGNTDAIKEATDAQNAMNDVFQAAFRTSVGWALLGERTEWGREEIVLGASRGNVPYLGSGPSSVPIPSVPIEIEPDWTNPYAKPARVIIEVQSGGDVVQQVVDASRSGRIIINKHGRIDRREAM